MSNKRYPGPKPFEGAQSDLFFGRKKEKEQLLNMLQNNQLNVLYGPSGYGKSSLLNASVIPKMEEEGYHTVNVRLGAWTPDSITTPLRSTVQGLSEKSEDLEETLLDKIVPFDTSLWYFTKTFQLNTKKPKLLFVFDQFEELFTYPEAEIKQYAQDLVELLHTGLPQRFRDALKKNDFSDDEQYDDVFTSLDVKIVMAIRSNRFHLLERLTPVLPRILSHTMELNALSREGGQRALVNPASMDGGEFECRKFTYEKNAETAILDFLTQDGKIEGILLQMLCAYFEQTIIDHPSKDTIGLEDLQVGGSEIEGLDRIVDLYYSTRINALPEGQKKGVQRFIEDGLVQRVGDGGMRLSMHQAQVLERFDLDEKILNDLVRVGLLRTDPFLRGGVTYELTHDRLLEPVLRSKTAHEEVESDRLRRELEEKAKKAEEERELRISAEKAKKIAEDQKHKAQSAQLEAERSGRRAKRFAWASGATLLLAVGLGLFAYSSWDDAQKNLELANASLEEVKRERAAKSLILCKEFLADAKRLSRANYCKSAKDKTQRAFQLMKEHAKVGKVEIRLEYAQQKKFMQTIEKELTDKQNAGECRQ